jgi:hypothetical protein
VSAVSPDAVRRRVTRKIRLWIVVLSAVIVTIAVLAVLTTGDHAPRNTVESTTASPIGIAAVPATLGVNRFQIKVSDAPDARTEVWSAGAGFVVLVDNHLSGYGADGAERWHYRRTDAAEIKQVHVYGGGTTIILAVTEPDAADKSLVALDAVTGTQLWTSSERKLVAAFEGYLKKPRSDDEWAPPSRFLVSRTPDHTDEWAGFDPRTGRELWSTSSLDCGPTQMVDTATHVVCLGFVDRSVGFALLDPATGKVTSRYDVPAPGVSPGVYAFLGDVIDASADGLVLPLWYSASTGKPPTTRRVFVDTRTWAVTQLGERTVNPSNDLHGDVLAADGPASVSLYGPQGSVRCSFDPHAAPAGDIAWLDRQIIGVVYTGTGPRPTQALTAFDRTDCRVVSALPVPGLADVTGITAAPGVTVITRTDDTGTYVDGYAPWPFPKDVPVYAVSPHTPCACPESP